MTYKITVQAAGLITTVDNSGKLPVQLWSKVRLRRHQTSRCSNCNSVLADWGYRPVTNLRNRMERICLTCAERENTE